MNKVLLKLIPAGMVIIAAIIMVAINKLTTIQITRSYGFIAIAVAYLIGFLIKDKFS